MMLLADRESVHHKAYVYQTGIMEPHCVLSTADSLSYCVNRPSCVRPDTLQLNSKAHVTRRAATRGVALYRDHGGDGAAFKFGVL